MQIEVIVQSRKEAIEAERLDVDRLELVTAIDEGGLTPAFNVMEDVLSSVSIPVQIMIRPHSRSFCYDEKDMSDVMESIEHVVAAGGKGVVFGAITDERKIDEAAIQQITSAYPSLEMTFHKAFDDVQDQTDAYITLEKYPQIKRILTSGGAHSCTDGAEQLKKLRDISAERQGPAIMPGAGLSPGNIHAIHAHVGANQYHFGRAVREEESYDRTFSKKALETIYRHTKND